MRITRLTIQNFRILGDIDLALAPSVNWFFGVNGAGKTSLLEALHVLARGRSFRSGLISPLIGPIGERFQVIARGLDNAGRNRILGASRESGRWEGRIDGQNAPRVAEFARALPLVLIEPGSHALIEGGPVERRRYLDWALFHVEHDYLDWWRRHARQLQQRNAALRSGESETVLDTFEHALVESAGALHEARARVATELEGQAKALKASLGIRLGDLELVYRPGWPRDTTLVDALKAARFQDRERGYTRHGPHRAELIPLIDGAPAAKRLSRGQQKLLSLILLLSQHSVLAESTGVEPLLLLDDPVSELDADHLQRLWGWLDGRQGQTWVTALTPPKVGLGEDSMMFHVEQGRVQALG